jgi:hypothetical protein
MANYCDWCRQGDGILYPGLWSSQYSRRSATCPQCSREIQLIDISSAARLVCKSRQTIYQWIQRRWTRTLRTAQGRKMICYTTLFLPPRDPESETWE